MYLLGLFVAAPFGPKMFFLLVKMTTLIGNR